MKKIALCSEIIFEFMICFIVVGGVLNDVKLLIYDKGSGIEVTL